MVKFFHLSCAEAIELYFILLNYSFVHTSEYSLNGSIRNMCNISILFWFHFFGQQKSFLPEGLLLYIEHISSTSCF